MSARRKHHFVLNTTRIILLLLILSSTGFTFLFNIMLRNNLENNLTSQLEKDTQIITGSIDTYFTRYDEIIRQMLVNSYITDYLKSVNSYSDVTNNPTTDYICNTLQLIQDSSDYISLAWLGVYSFHGIIIPDKEYQISDDYKMEDRAWFTDMLESEQTITHSQPYIDIVTGNLIISIISPVYDQDTFVGNVGIDITISDLQNFITSYEISNNGYAFLLNEKGQYIVNPEGDFNNTNNILNSDIQLAAIGYRMIHGELGIADYEMNGQEYYVAYGPIELNGWSVGSVIPKDELRSQLTLLNLMSISISLASTIILLILIVNLRLQKKYASQSSLLKEIQEYNKQLADKDAYIHNLAFLDPLTGIANRRRFLEYLEDSLKEKNSGAVAIIDFDNFKEINDTMGHVYGDTVLIQVATLLSGLEDEHIKVCRFGGDEFLILMDKIEDRAIILDYAGKILNLFKKKLIIGNEEVYISMSMGLSVYPQDSELVNQLIMNADLAMYSVKRSGKNNFSFFDRSMTDAVVERTNTDSILRAALNNDGFRLVYQPQVDINTYEISGFEALIRLKSNELYPGKFIPAAEESGIIVPIGRWLVLEVIQQLVSWRNQGLLLKPISINFSAKQIEDAGFVEYLLELLKDNDIPPSLIEIEITETAIMENKSETILLLDHLKKNGIRLSLDDFGTGYSSLSYLTFLPTDKLKLDKSICDRYLEPDTVRVIENIIDLSHTLGMKVVAEGIEDIKQYELLKNSRCDYIQGYLFSEPLPPNEAGKIFNNIEWYKINP